MVRTLSDLRTVYLVYKCDCDQTLVMTPLVAHDLALTNPML